MSSPERVPFARPGSECALEGATAQVGHRFNRVRRCCRGFATLLTIRAVWRTVGALNELPLSAPSGILWL